MSSINRQNRFSVYLISLLFFGLSASCTTVLDIAKKDPIQVDPYTRSMGSKLDDSNLETILSHNINKAHPDLATAHIEVHSFNGVVLLSGEVPSQELKDRASSVIKEVSTVRQIYNELAVRANTSFLSRSNDSFLRQKIAFRFLKESNLKGLDLQIVVEDSVAFLMGLANAEQAEIAAHEASLTGGIRRVVKVFEYVD